MLLRLKKHCFFLRPIIICILLIFPQLTLAVDSTPTEVIQTNTDKVLSILRQIKSEGQSVRQREGEILKIVSSYFNFDEMSKRSLGDSYNQQPPEKIQEFSKLFKKLLFNTFVGRMEKFQDEKIFYDSQKINDDFATVKTHFMAQSESISVDYKLRKEGGQWKVYDVIFEGISFVDNYRSQIASILSNQSFDALLNMLRQKVERLG